MIYKRICRQDQANEALRGLGSDDSQNTTAKDLEAEMRKGEAYILETYIVSSEWLRKTWANAILRIPFPEMIAISIGGEFFAPIKSRIQEFR